VRVVDPTRLGAPGPLGLEAAVSQALLPGGSYFATAFNVWTGAASASTPGDAGTSCAGWSVGTGAGIVGNALESSEASFDTGASQGCGTVQHLYCFEQ